MSTLHSTNVHAQLQDIATNARILALSGKNFSGRSDLLRQVSGLISLDDDAHTVAEFENRHGVYVGPAIYDSLSGIASTVRDELRLHAGYPDRCAWSEDFTAALGFEPLLDRSPFTLSGGEQALLAITNALLVQPQLVALDCALEQLSLDLRLRLLHNIRITDGYNCPILIADNRLNELEGSLESIPIERFVPRAAAEDPYPITFRHMKELPPVARCSISFERVTYRYPRGPTVLKDASLSLEPCRVYSLQGKNGAGKSTFAKLLAGVLRPSSGCILVNGQRATLWRHPGGLVAYHFQNPDLQLFSSTVHAELASSASSTPCITASVVDKLVATFGLEAIAGQCPQELPFVLRKRVAIAATLAMHRPCVVLDEPSLAQDDSVCQSIAQIVNSLTALGSTVVVISHSPWFRGLLEPIPISLEGGVFHRL